MKFNSNHTKADRCFDPWHFTHKHTCNINRSYLPISKFEFKTPDRQISLMVYKPGYTLFSIEEMISSRRSNSSADKGSCQVHTISGTVSIWTRRIMGPRFGCGRPCTTHLMAVWGPSTRCYFDVQFNRLFGCQQWYVWMLSRLHEDRIWLPAFFDQTIYLPSNNNNLKKVLFKTYVGHEKSVCIFITEFYYGY